MEVRKGPDVAGPTGLRFPLPRPYLLVKEVWVDGERHLEPSIVYLPDPESELLVAGPRGPSLPPGRVWATVGPDGFLRTLSVGRLARSVAPVEGAVPSQAPPSAAPALAADLTIDQPGLYRLVDPPGGSGRQRAVAVAVLPRPRRSARISAIEFRQQAEHPELLRSIALLGDLGDCSLDDFAADLGVERESLVGEAPSGERCVRGAEADYTLARSGGGVRVDLHRSPLSVARYRVSLASTDRCPLDPLSVRQGRFPTDEQVASWRPRATLSLLPTDGREQPALLLRQFPGEGSAVRPPTYDGSSTSLQVQVGGEVVALEPKGVWGVGDLEVVPIGGRSGDLVARFTPVSDVGLRGPTAQLAVRLRPRASAVPRDDRGAVRLGSAEVEDDGGSKVLTVKVEDPRQRVSLGETGERGRKAGWETVECSRGATPAKGKEGSGGSGPARVVTCRAKTREPDAALKVFCKEGDVPCLEVHLRRRESRFGLGDAGSRLGRSPAVAPFP